MSTPRGTRISTSMGDWVTDQNKRTAHEARRPQIRRASDLLGPGFGPHAILLTDWNSEEATFNGFFYSDPGALHAPDGTNIFLGLVIGSPTGHGIQQAFSHPALGGPPMTRWVRSFHTHGTETPLFSTWASI